jgi:mannosylfructose-phosphate synthase
MACGTPTVVTTEGGLWEQVTWGLEALYANPFDPPAYGHAISAILQHPEVYDQLAKYGSQKARERFTWTGIAQRLLNHVDRAPRPLLDESEWVERETIDKYSGDEAWQAGS